MTKLWPERPLGEMLELFDSKRHPLSSLERESMQGVYPYYGASGIIDHLDKYIFDGEYLLIAEDGENLNSRKLPIAFWARGKFWVNNHAHVVLGKAGDANTDFIRYCFSSADISGFVTGSAQPKLSQANLKKIKFRFPTFDTQRKIAAVLAGYDDLIEANRRRIALLERMAEEIYREWFVRLRFPGHEKTKLSHRPLRTFVSSYIGGGWGEETRSPKFTNEVYVIRGTDFESIREGDISSVPIRYINDSGLESRRLQAGDLIVENSVNHQSRTAGKSILVTQHLLDLFDGDVICASFCKLIRPANTMHSRFLWLNFRLLFEQGLFDYFQNIATNGIANLQAERFMDRHLIPFDESLDLSIFDSLDTSHLAKTQANLQRTRDLLLPRLISGKLPVEDLDIAFPPSMDQAAS